MVSSELYLRITPGRFHYLKFILEAYDNLAILSSHDNKKGIVLLRYPLDNQKEVFMLLQNICNKLC